MREIDLLKVTEEIEKACIDANRFLPSDLEKRVRYCAEYESSEPACSVMNNIIKNIDIAGKSGLPLCQDTGMAVVFAEIGQDIHFVNGDFETAVNEGVRRGYLNGLLRCSVVSDPLERVNTGDNTPAVIHSRIVPGDKLRITVAPKGFGSENMSSVKMFKPTASPEDIVGFVVDTVRKAGSNPCPPVVVGVGIGGTFEKCALLSKKALCRSVDVHNTNPFYADLEKKMLDEINSLDIGPQGFGGKTTALSVAIETYPTHIAGLPVAVNMGCHVTRHLEVVL